MNNFFGAKNPVVFDASLLIFDDLIFLLIHR
jgi:hypothetical protein